MRACFVFPSRNYLDSYTYIYSGGCRCRLQIHLDNDPWSGARHGRESSIGVPSVPPSSGPDIHFFCNEPRWFEEGLEIKFVSCLVVKLGVEPDYYNK